MVVLVSRWSSLKRASVVEMRVSHLLILNASHALATRNCVRHALGHEQQRHVVRCSSSVILVLLVLLHPDHPESRICRSSPSLSCIIHSCKMYIDSPHHDHHHGSNWPPCDPMPRPRNVSIVRPGRRYAICRMSSSSRTRYVARPSYLRCYNHTGTIVTLAVRPQLTTSSAVHQSLLIPSIAS